MIQEKKWKLIDLLKRKFFIKFEIKSLLLKSIILNKKLPYIYRYNSVYQKTKCTRISSVIQQKNKCVKTGRVWATEKHSRYSRFVFRIESNSGNIPGFRRASW